MSLVSRLDCPHSFSYEVFKEKLQTRECVILRVNLPRSANYFDNSVKLEFPKIQNPENFSITLVNLEECPDFFKKWFGLIKAGRENFSTSDLKERDIVDKWSEKNRVLLKLALLEKIRDFFIDCRFADENIIHTDKPRKQTCNKWQKINFNERTGFRKKSNIF